MADNSDYNVLKTKAFTAGAKSPFFTVDSKLGEVVVGTITNPVPNQDANIPFYVIGSQNSYFGINVVNYGGGGTTSTDIVAVNSSATASSSAGTFIDMGINGASWNDNTFAVFDQNAGYLYTAASNIYVGGSGTVSLFSGGFTSKGFVGLTVDPNRNVAVGTGSIGSAATNGFFYIRGGAGAPTGVPTAKSGLVPMYYDTTNNNFYMYNSGWLKASTGGTWA